jgi:hypothetical protein
VMRRLDYATPSTPSPDRASRAQRLGYASIAVCCCLAVVVFGLMAIYAPILAVVAACFLAIGVHYLDCAVTGRVSNRLPPDMH